MLLKIRRWYQMYTRGQTEENEIRFPGPSLNISKADWMFPSTNSGNRRYKIYTTASKGTFWPKALPWKHIERTIVVEDISVIEGDTGKGIADHQTGQTYYLPVVSKSGREGSDWFSHLRKPRVDPTGSTVDIGGSVRVVGSCREVCWLQGYEVLRWRKPVWSQAEIIPHLHWQRKSTSTILPSGRWPPWHVRRKHETLQWRIMAMHEQIPGVWRDKQDNWMQGFIPSKSTGRNFDTKPLWRWTLFSECSKHVAQLLMQKDALRRKAVLGFRRWFDSRGYAG